MTILGIALKFGVLSLAKTPFAAAIAVTSIWILARYLKRRPPDRF